MQSLDLSEVPPAARQTTGAAAAVALYEILSRIPLPPLNEIPDASQVKQPASTGPTRWVIPNTEIALERAQSGPRSGEFLFSAETVARADEFYERVRGLPYIRPVPFGNLKEIPTPSPGAGWFRTPGFNRCRRRCAPRLPVSRAGSGSASPWSWAFSRCSCG